MKFSDRIIRNESDFVYIKKDEKSFEASDVTFDLSADIQQHNIAYSKEAKSPINLYKVRSIDVKIGENIYNEKGEFEAYRSE